MLATIATLVLAAAEAAKEEKSHTAFYICGGLLAIWAVVVSVIGLTQPNFPVTEGQRRGVMGLTVLLVASAMVTAVATAG